MVKSPKKLCQQHPVFPSGHPSKYWLGSTLLNFSDRTRTGVFSVIWPLAREGAKKIVFEVKLVLESICYFVSRCHGSNPAQPFCTEMYLKKHLFGSFSCQRPYHAEYTSSRPITEVKQRRAQSVLGWVTAWEHWVLLAFLFWQSIVDLICTFHQQIVFQMLCAYLVPFCNPRWQCWPNNTGLWATNIVSMHEIWRWARSF